MNNKNISNAGNLVNEITYDKWIVRRDCVEYNDIGKVMCNVNCKSLKDTIIAIPDISRFNDDKDMSIFVGIMSQCGNVKMGGGRCDYGLFANGFVDIIMDVSSIESYYENLNGIMRYSGGIATDWGGRKLTKKSSGHALISCNKKIHSEVIKIIKSHM